MAERITPDELRFLAECAEKELARDVATKGDLMALDLRDARAEVARLSQIIADATRAQEIAAGELAPMSLTLAILKRAQVKEEE